MYLDDQSASRKHRKKTTNFWISNESFQDSLIRVRNNINTRKEGHKIIISIPQNYNILAILKMETLLKFPISDSSMMKLAKIQRFESKVQPWVFHPHLGDENYSYWRRYEMVPTEYKWHTKPYSWLVEQATSPLWGDARESKMFALVGKEELSVGLESIRGRCSVLKTSEIENRLEINGSSDGGCQIFTRRAWHFHKGESSFLRGGLRHLLQDLPSPFERRKGIFPADKSRGVCPRRDFEGIDRIFHLSRLRQCIS